MFKAPVILPTAENANDPADEPRRRSTVGTPSEYFLQIWRGIGQRSNSPKTDNALSWANIRHKFGVKFRTNTGRPDPGATAPVHVPSWSGRSDDSSERPALPQSEPSVTQHIPGLRRYARVLVGDPSEADDLVQECLTRALARRHTLGRIGDLRAYLFTILHNVHVDRAAQQRRSGPSLSLDHVQASLACQPDQLPRLELIDLASALSRLPVEQRDVVLLVGVEGMSYRETAGVLDIPIGTVMSRLSRGREALRQSMAIEGPAPLPKAASL
jgi:RNA polymerase sigma-70 factor (ECF subfamily)